MGTLTTDMQRVVAKSEKVSEARLSGDKSLRSYLLSKRGVLRPHVFVVLSAAFLCFAAFASLSQQAAGSHPDERGKVNQAVSGQRNWHHPQFLLTNLEIGQLLSQGKWPDLVKVGRYTSNAYAVLTIVLIATVGGRLFGTIGLYIFFIMFAANAAILVSGRYIKEDIFMIFGISLLLLALTFDRSDVRESRLAAITAGLGCAVAMSSKYIGVVFVVTFLVAYFYNRGKEWRADLSGLVWSFVIATLVINYPLVLEIPNFLNGLGMEFNHATGTHDGIWLGKFSDVYLGMIREIMPVTALAAIPLFLILLRSKDVRRPVAALLIFSLGSICVYGATIQWAPVKIPRYCFPLLVLLPFTFLIAAGELWRNTKTSVIRLLVVIPGVFLIHQLASSSMTIVRAIQNDTRDQLFLYLTTSPQLKNAVVLEDRYSRLNMRLQGNYAYPVLNTRADFVRLQRPPAEEKPSPNPNGIVLRTAAYAADVCSFGGCDDVDYIVITCTTFNRFFRSDVHLDAANVRRKKMYETWLGEANYVERLGSSQDDFESRFGAYESPCAFVIRNPRAKH